MITSPSNSLISENLKRIRYEVDEALAKSGRSRDDLQIMAVTKTVEPELINAAIHGGISLLGENRVQEFLSKEAFYDLGQAEVHFIGTLQSNKVKQIIHKVSMIESVSSLKLAQEINRCAGKADLKIDILLEVNIGREESKSGFDRKDLLEYLPEISYLSNICVKGLMCIPPRGDSEKYFFETRQLFIDIKEKNIDNIHMHLLSMGMSADYQLAVKYHSNIIRLGTALFGARNYL